MATAVAGALASINAPVIGGVTIFQNVQQQINQYALATYRILLTGLKDTAVKTEDVASKGVDASSRVTSGIARTISHALHMTYDIGKFSLKTFSRVVEKAVGSPESVVVAVLMYRVVDMTVNVQSQSVSDAIENFTRSFESTSISPPQLETPTVSFKPLYDALDGFKSMVEDSINNMISQMDTWVSETKPDSANLGCSQPSLEQSVTTVGLAWLGYGLCLLGQALVSGLLWLGWRLVDLGVTIAKFLLTGLKYFVDFIIYVNKGLLSILEKAVNGLLYVLTGFVNLIIGALFFIANAVFEWVVKKPIVFIIRYVVKPLATVIMDAFNNVKNIMKTILCDYLRISPFALGFTTWITRGWKRALGSLVLSVLFVSLLAPECAMIPLSTPPAVAYPTPPPPSATPVSSSYVAVVSIGVGVFEGVSGIGSRQYSMGSAVIIGSTEEASMSQPSIYSGISLVSISVSDSATGYSAVVNPGSSTILISVSD